MTFTKNEKLIAAIGYVVFMVLFFFLGIPKVSFVTFIVGFVVLTGLYALLVYFFKKHFVKP